MSEANDSLLSFERAVTATVVSDVQIAPDGSSVLYVTTAASVEGAPSSTIWQVSSDGSRRRPIATAQASNDAPRWSPDGKRILFVSDRAERGKNQLYLLELDGGEAVRVTNFESGVVRAVWSPDGSKIALTAMDNESEGEKERREAGDDIKVFDRDVRKAGLWVIEAPASNADVDAENLPEPKRISPEGVHVGAADPGFSWSPDGTSIAATVAPSPKAHYTFNPDLVIYSLDGEAKTLEVPEGLLSTPRYSPDGSTIAFVAAEEVIPALFSLQTMPAAGGAPRIVAPGYEGSFHNFYWLPDGQRMIAGVERGQNANFMIANPSGGDLTPAFTGFDQPGSGSFLMSLSADGKRAAFVFAGDYSYGEVYVADLGGEPRQLTDLNPWTRDYTFGEVREVRWASKDGLEIEGMLILPVGYQEGQRAPLMVHIHGGPCGAWTRHLIAGWHDWGQFLAQRGYAVFMPNPRGSSGRGTKFLCGIVGCYGEPDWDDIMTGVDYLIDQGIADPNQLVVGGWSGGGFLTNWTITHSKRFKAAVSGAGISNWVSFQGTADVRSVFDRYMGDVTTDVETHWRLSPIRLIDQATTPTLILYGEADIRVPLTQGMELYEGLKARGVETQLVAYPGEPHGIGGRKHQIDVLSRAIGWYERHLGRTAEE